MALSPQSRLGRFEVSSLLGAGGMGEVYRAHDPRLGRDVAIKILPHEVARDDHRRRRFLQEARAASALNHPGIVAIYEMESADGVDFIVMEHVAGKTVDAAIRSGLRLNDALRIAIAVADALAAAHAAGIVHRDLKPANVMVTPNGAVKVLDFGLAKLLAADSQSDADVTVTLPQQQEALSRPGAIAGTPAYMSPEQATGGLVDARSDVFSFGSLLYEMVTGRRAFDLGSIEGTLQAVAVQPPTPPREIVPALPIELERLILRCLRKDPDRRYQHISDVKVELEDIKADSESGLTSVATTQVANARPRRLGWVLAGVALVAMAGVGTWIWRRPVPPDEPAPRLESLTSFPGSELQPALSPDGDQLAFSWEGEANTGPLRPLRRIWVKFVEGSEVRQLTNGSGHDSFPAWSPDGRQIAFVRTTPAAVRPVVSALYVVSSQGGVERTLGEFPVVNSQITWTPDGRGVVAAHDGVGGGQDAAAGALHIIWLDGTPPTGLTRPPAGGSHRNPAFSVSRRELAYAEVREASRDSSTFIDALGLDVGWRPKGEPRRLTPSPVQGIYGLTWTPHGQTVVYSSGFNTNYLWRADPSGRTEPERIELAGKGATSPVAAAGKARLAFVRALHAWDIWALEPKKPPRAWTASSFEDREPSYSPDGKRVAFGSGRSGDRREVWIADADGSNPTQLTRGPVRSVGSPSWSPDGRRLSFDGIDEGVRRDVWVIDVTGGPPRRVTNGPVNNGLAVWSPDNRWIYYRQLETNGADIWRVPAEGGTPERVTHHVRPEKRFQADRARFSPDGHVLYYKQADYEAPLVAHPLDGGPERVVVDCVAGRGFDVGPGGIYYIGCASAAREQGFYRLDPTSGRRELLGQAELAYDHAVSVSPVGGPLLFTKVTHNFDLMVIDRFR
jgi:serine/threonine protein kinase